MKRVLLTDYAWPDVELERRILGQVDAELVVASDTSAGTLCAAARDADAIMTTWAQVTAQVIAAAPRCQIVSRLGIGLDNIDVAYCTARQIPVTNVPGYCTVEVAEHTIALLLALARNIAHFAVARAAGRYSLNDAPPMHRLAGQTLGIIGCGQIGKAVATRALALGLQVVTTRHRQPCDVVGVTELPLEELLATSDFVSLHLPLNAATRGLMNAERLGQMKRGAKLINTARGAVVDHDALARLLASGQIAAAALDVQDPEPPDLAQMPYADPRVIITPHAAFVSEESLIELRTRAARQVAARLTGQRPENIVNSWSQDG